jgi:hypothetical protein
MVTRWPPWEVTTLQNNLDVLSDLVENPSDQVLNSDAYPWLCRLLVVRSCGYLEQVVVEVCRAYVRERSGGTVRMFAHSWLDRTGNPTPDRLGDLVGRFDSTMREDLLAFLADQDERLSRAVYFMVDRRNRIAHGLNEGISRTKALELKLVACEVADWFVLRFNPDR